MRRGGQSFCSICGGSREDRYIPACRDCRAALRAERLRAARLALGRLLVVGAAVAALAALLGR